MISLGVRYIDYGLTGGLFLFVGMAVFGWYHPAAVQAMLGNFQDFRNQLNPAQAGALDTLLNGIFAPLFVVGVFATGLLLDLFGSLLVLFDARIFLRHLKRNKVWIGQLVAKYEEFLGEDMDQFLTLPNTWKLFSSWEDKGGLFLTPFGRIESILLSHLLLTADPPKLEMLMDQVRTCRIARAVASGLILLPVVLSFMQASVGQTSGWGYWAILLAAWVLCFFIVSTAYSKFCSSLFSLLFVLLRTSPADSVQMQESALGQNAKSSA